MVDADVAKAFADGRVPANTTYLTPEYLSESRDEPAVAGILAVFIITSILLCCRFLSRIFIVKSFGLDDSLALFSYACYTTFMALSLLLIFEGSGRHIEYIQYVLPHSTVNNTEVVDYAAHLIYTTALFFCRLSGLAFFNRICNKHPTFRISIWIAAAFLFSAFLVQFFLILLHCNPITGLWPYAWQAESADYKCLNWGVVYVTNSGLSLVCDFVLFSIPTSMIAILKLSRSRKVVLAIVLLPGTLVIGISCARLWLCVVGQWASDGSWFYDPQLAIEVAEIGCTLTALSVPSFKPILSKWYSHMKSSIGSRSGGRNGQSSGGGGGGGAATTNRKSSFMPQQQPWLSEPRDSKCRTEVGTEVGSKGRESDDDDFSMEAEEAESGSSRQESQRDGGDGVFVTRDVDLRSIPLAHYKTNSTTRDTPRDLGTDNNV